MTPEPSLVSELKAYDRLLRIRWGRHSEKFLVERYHPHSDPRLAHATPPEDTASPIRRDLYEGWREGYVHVLTVPRELCYWHFIAPELHRLDGEKQGGMKGINRQLDEQAVAQDRAEDKRIEDWSEVATDEAYERLAWMDGRRVAVTNPEPEYTDTGLGFKVVDRRRR